MVVAGVCCLALAGHPVAATVAADRGGGEGRPSSPAAKPNDPLFPFQWNLPAIQIPDAWAVSRGGGATVAVLDTGVSYRNRRPYRRAPDLAGTRFVAGRDFVDGDPYPDDVSPANGRRTHGTLIAGIIAQTTGNAIGGAGVAPAATIMPVRVLEPDLSGSASAIARGVRFAVDRGADVINLSIAGPAPAPVLTKALRHAEEQGVTVVAAAGNDGRPAVGWPAAHPTVVAVGAVSRDLTRARYSNYGRALDLVAPAGAGDRLDTGNGPPDGVLAQTLKGGPADFCFCFTASTSAAAAEVSGVAALLVGSGRTRGPAQVRAALRSGARDLGAPGRDAEYGRGLVQARRALSIAGGTRGRVPVRGRVPDPSPGRGVWPAGAALGAGLVGLVVLVLLRRRRRRHRSA
ncbi:MAG: S8 family serine peptidase [Thermoleophilaceae bacterium]